MLGGFSGGAGSSYQGGSASAKFGDYKTGPQSFGGSGFSINAAPAWGGGVSSGGSASQMSNKEMMLYGSIALVAGIVAVKWISRK